MSFFNHISKSFKKVSIVLSLFAIASTAQAQLLNPTPGKSVTEQMMNSSLHRTENRQQQIQEILNYAYQFKGVRYRYGSPGPTSFDCSGFTSYVFNRFGYTLSRSSRDQVNNGTRVPRNQEQPGDLVFFGGRGNRAGVGHVGIVVSVDETGFSFIHAATRTGITVSHSTDSYYRVRYRGATRIVQ